MLGAIFDKWWPQSESKSYFDYPIHLPIRVSYIN